MDPGAQSGYPDLTACVLLCSVYLYPLHSQYWIEACNLGSDETLIAGQLLAIQIQPAPFRFVYP